MPERTDSLPTRTDRPRQGSYFDLISDVADRDMKDVGIAPNNADIQTRALHTEAVRRVQVWTFEWMAASLPPSDPMKDMFQQLADGLRSVPDLDLWTGRPGA